ncbi:hypothetical protein, partial [Variovorax rhizosphaerae]
DHAAILIDSVLATANLESVEVHVLPGERDLKDLVKPGDARIATHQISGLMSRSTARSCSTSWPGHAPISISKAYFAALHTPRKWMLSVCQ